MKKIFLLITFIFYSCSSHYKNENNKKILIKFWHPFSTTSTVGKTLVSIVEEFNKTHPQWEIKPEGMASYSVLKQKLLASIIAGNQPTLSLAYENWISKLYRGNKIVIFDEFVEKNELDEIKKDLFEIFVESCSMDGKLVSMPFNKSMPVLYYNKDVFDEYNIKNPPQTWKEFLEIAKKLTFDKNNDGKIDFYGTITRVNITDFLNFLKQNGGEILSENERKPLFNSIEGIEALKFFYSWKFLHNIAKFYISGNPYEYQNDFTSGKCAMIIGSCASRSYIINLVTFRLGIAFIFGYKKKAVSVYGTNIVLFKDATDEQKKGAWEFIKYFISPQVTAKWSLLTGYMPVRKSALKTEILQKEFKKDPQLKTTILQLKYGYLEPSDESWLLGREYLSEAINEAFLDKKIEKAYIEYQNALKSKSAETNIKRDFLEKIMEKQIKFYLDKAAEKTKRWMF